MKNNEKQCICFHCQLFIGMNTITKVRPDIANARRYTIKEVSEILSVPVRRLYLHIHHGKLKSGRREVDNKIIVYGRDILDYWHKFN